MNERLYRSRDDRIIFGVAGGVAENFNLDPSLVRILWVILTPLTGGLLFVLYVVMAFVVPEEPEGSAWPGWGQPQHAGGGPAASTGGTAGVGGAAASGPGAVPGSAAFGAGRSATSAGTTPGPDSGASGAAAAGSSPGSAPGPGMPAAGPGPGTSDAPGAPSATGHGIPVAQMPGFLPPSMAGGPSPSSGTPLPAPPTPPWQQGAPPPGSGPGGPMDWRAQRRAERDARRAARRAGRANGYEGSAGVIGGIVLVLIGGYFIARTFVPGIDLGQFWPVLLVAIGLVLLVGSIRRGDGPPHA